MCRSLNRVPQGSDQFQIPFVGPDLVQSADDVCFGGFYPFNLFEDLRFFQHVGMGCISGSRVIAEGAAAAADVRRIDLQVEHIGGLPAKPLLTVGQGRRPQPVKPVRGDGGSQAVGLLP
jgi:hypothetical protein